MALFPSREGHFSLRWIRGIRAIRRKACVALRRDMSGSWACDALAHTCDALAHTIEGSTLGNILILVYPSYHYWFAPYTNTALIVDYYWLEAPLNSNASNDLRKYFGLHHRITPSPSYFFSPRLTKSWYLCLGHRPKRLGIGLHLSRKSIPIY